LNAKLTVNLIHIIHNLH